MFARVIFHISDNLLISVRASDKRITCDEEFSDSEDEGEPGEKRQNRENFRHRKRLRQADDDKKKDDKNASEDGDKKDVKQEADKTEPTK